MTMAERQLTREDLATMSPEEVRQALHEGRFAALLAGKVVPEPEIEAGEVPPQSADLGARGSGPAAYTLEWLTQATPGEVRRALHEGRLQRILETGQ